jgi:hypothetical protein
MELQKNPFFVSEPVSGKNYKLWSLPKGSTVIRDGLKIVGREVGPFEIIRQFGDTTIGKTNWDYEFHLDASLDVIAA